MKKLQVASFSSLCLLFSVVGVKAKKVDLSNAEGKVITVNLISSTESDVKVRLLSGARKVMTIPLSSLSDESQTLIAEWKADGGGLSTDFDVDVKVSKDIEKPKTTNNNTKKNKNRNGNKSKPAQPVKNTLQLTVTVTNDDNNIPTAAADMKVIAIGRSMEKSSNYFILDIQKESVPELSGRESTEFEMPAINFTYVDGNKENSSGARYVGYAVLILDAEGEVIGGKSVPSSLYDRNLENLAAVSKGQLYKSDMSLSD
ncbi:hypothetical protein ACFPK9_05845 [Rubritalea spongiae]|uniref:Uncharacterized protein n=1 Tax=Rubritalea spongiae TaxID=430797 RepID=A0ABW5E3X5_9BACT